MTILLLDKFFRCICHVASGLAIVGEQWIIVDIKLMLLA